MSIPQAGDSDQRESGSESTLYREVGPFRNGETDLIGTCHYRANTILRMAVTRYPPETHAIPFAGRLC